MIKLIFVFIINLVVIFVFGQKDPYMLSTMYIMDAVGNLDSIEVGYDTAARFSINADFGETVDISPLDSVIDIRIQHFSHWTKDENVFFSKRAVTELLVSTTPNCYEGKNLIIYVKAKNMPFTIWAKDPDEFLKVSCVGLNRVMWTSDFSYLFKPPWIFLDAKPRYGCVRAGGFTIDFKNDTTSRIEGNQLLEKLNIQNKLDTMYALCFTTSVVNEWCDTVTVSTKDPKQEFEDNTYFFPNPVQNMLFLKKGTNNNILGVSIYNQQGQMIKVLQNQDINQGIFVSDLPVGLYFARILFSNKSIGTYKFVKSD